MQRDVDAEEWKQLTDPTTHMQVTNYRLGAEGRNQMHYESIFINEHTERCRDSNYTAYVWNRFAYSLDLSQELLQPSCRVPCSEQEHNWLAWYSLDLDSLGSGA